MSLILPKQDKLHELFDYEDGGLYWKKCFHLWRMGTPAGTVGINGYIVVRIGGIQYKRSRLIYKFHHGVDPVQIDHLNRIRDDDRIENLRDVSPYENANNRKDNNGQQSGHPGVTRGCKNDSWKVVIVRNGQEYYIGRSHKLLEAIAMRKHYEYHMDELGLPFEEVPEYAHISD